MQTNRPQEVEIHEDVFLPCYRHLKEDNSDIKFLWGGRDSGKSQDIAQRKIEECLEADYFRYLLIKKTANSIKDSQWQTIKDLCKEWKIDRLFTFKTNPLEIICNENGNRFIARGCDDPINLRSVRNPSGAWIEEGNQLSDSDWNNVITTLRSDSGKINIDTSLNPEVKGGNYEDFHLYKNFFKEHYENGIYTFKSSIESTDPNTDEITQLTFSCTHTTYHDNPYVNKQRRAILESLRETNPYYYRVFTLGLWGKTEAKSPFCTHYDPAKHESELSVFDPTKRITIVVDFNIDPFAVIFCHRWRDKYGPHCHQFDEGGIKGGTIPAMINYIIQGPYVHYLPSALLSGDFRGNERSLEQADHASKFEQLRRGLSMAPSQVIVSPNPLHTQSGQDMNYVLLYHPDYKINPVTCKGTCRDMRSVQKDNHGGIIKLNRTDPNQRADWMDCQRYNIHNFEREWIQQHQRSQKRLGT